MADESLGSWFADIRVLLTQLHPGSHSERYPITLVGLSDCFGARCSTFGASGATAHEAMTKLREQIRDAVFVRERADAARSRADTEPSPPPSLRAG